MCRLARHLTGLHVETIAAVLHGRAITLNETQSDAYATYPRAVTHVTNAGHAGLLVDEPDGFLSALHTTAPYNNALDNNDAREPARLPHAA